MHLVTGEIITAMPELPGVRAGLLHVFLQHTSASLTINENADPEVRADLSASLDAIAPEEFPYRHSSEGPDDMPAHVKTSLLGCGLVIPIGAGRLLLGTWQGVYLAEHRDRAEGRTAVLTVWGELR